MVSEGANSNTLIIGSTGFIGRFIAEASLDSGHPTYLLVRPASPGLSKTTHTIDSFQDRGAIILTGSVDDEDFLEKVLKEHKIEVVISVVGGARILDQLILLEAIKSAGTVKRFLPSEFGHDIDRADPEEPGLSMYNEKRRVRRAIEAAGIPYTYICCNSIAGWPYHDNIHPADVLPPLDRFHIYGDGTVKAYFVAGSDIGKFTMKTIHDVRTINKSVHFRPPSNLFNINQLASLWEQCIGRKLPRITISEDDLLAAAKEMQIPQSIVASFTHDIFIKGCQVNYEIEKPSDIEVCSLYPDTPFMTVDECFQEFATRVVVDVSEAKLAQKSKSSTTNDFILVPNAKPEVLAITPASAS
ncbi:leucoanthocyanidin reductase-like isoform X2 [Prunus avium]|uniref:Leucoanthocyanidin reductase-like isoform X1 n=2 Tax=Prunus avium TaxID=42229 RepID=A0A6P5S178_PRUAV|nr:leucoanthocyanidin reductase-like isoform X1 [Prunus avium]XP_021810771.1 leucoanthocyanidin reductase-like isoform X2 [Prunus avium]XP_021810772.1 leucoanthocyanidin reductase-like isoform X2 [Prunus avium]